MSIMSLFGSWKRGSRSNRESAIQVKTSINFESEMWFIDLQRLSNEELMRMYSVIKEGKYNFAKNAWYIPIEENHRCPIMVAKGYSSPNTPEKMVEFEETAKLMEQDFRHFIDAWDFGYITKKDIENAILKILELRNIEIIERIR